MCCSIYIGEQAPQPLPLPPPPPQMSGTAAVLVRCSFTDTTLGRLGISSCRRCVYRLFTGNNMGAGSRGPEQRLVNISGKSTRWLIPLSVVNHVSFTASRGFPIVLDMWLCITNLGCHHHFSLCISFLNWTVSFGCWGPTSWVPCQCWMTMLKVCTIHHHHRSLNGVLFFLLHQLRKKFSRSDLQLHNSVLLSLYFHIPSIPTTVLLSSLLLF